MHTKSRKEAQIILFYFSTLKILNIDNGKRYNIENWKHIFTCLHENNAPITYFLYQIHELNATCIHNVAHENWIELPLNWR